MDDINELDAELVLFGIKVHRTAGYGIYATGSELDIRKAMRHFCRYQSVISRLSRPMTTGFQDARPR